MKQNTLTPTTENETLLMQFVTKSLLELGIKPNLKEFTYLKEVIFLHPDIFQKNKRYSYLYSVISEKYGASALRVERAIRTSIEAVWV